MSPTASPHDLLYAMLALQLELLSLDEVRDALDKSDGGGGGLREALLDSGKLRPQQDKLVGALVEAHLSTAGGDASRSLETIEQTSLGRSALEQLTDRNNEGTVSFDQSSHHSAVNGGASPETRVTESGERFRKIRLHATGGLGEVSLARDEQLKRDVALKELQQKYLSDAVKLKRFVLEGEVTGALEHPNIVPVYAMGVDAQGEPFYAMRFVKGESLNRAALKAHSELPPKQLLRRNCLSFRRLISRLIAVCQAIEYAHGRGVLHRDIKPANIMLGRHGETYVVDWGLAKTAGSPSDESSLSEEFLGGREQQASDTTRQGSIVGTPGYMSPEQASGQVESLGPWSDVYSLGATLYFLLVGRPPLDLEEGDVYSYVSRVEEGDFETPRQCRPETPRELEAICLKAMAGPVEDRYHSASELADELERWLGDEPVRACPPTMLDKTWRWCRRHRDWVVAGAIFLTVATIASVFAARTFYAQAEREKKLANANLILAESEAEARGLADERYLDARQSVDRWLIGYTEALRNYPGVQDVRRTMLEQAAADYARFAEEEVDDPTLKLEQARTLLRLGNVRRILRDPDGATDAYDKALALFEKLEAASDVGQTKGLLALAAADRGEFESADRLFGDAENILVDLSATQDDQVEAQANLATVLTNRGLAFTAAGDAESACVILKRSVTLCETRSQVERDQLQPRIALATACVALGQAQLATGDANAARSHFTRAGDLFAAVALLDPLNPRHAESTAATSLHLATAARRIGDLAEERAAYDEAIELYGQLSDAQPDVPAYREGRAMAKNDLGQVLMELGDLPTAKDELKEAAATLEGLALSHPLVAKYREAYAVSLDNLADALLRSGETGEAINVANAALGAMQSLVAAWPDVAPYQQRKGVILSRLAQAQAILGEAALAEKRFEEAEQVFDAIFESLNPAPETLYAAATVSTRHGEWLWWRGETERAQPILATAERRWRQLVEQSGDPQFANAAAWFFASCPADEFSDLGRARELAHQAHSASPMNLRFQLTRQFAELGEPSVEEPFLAELTQESAPLTMQARLGFIEATHQAATGDADAAKESWSTANELRREQAPGEWELAALAQLVAQQLGLEEASASPFQSFPSDSETPQ